MGVWALEFQDTGKSWKIQKFQKGYRGGMTCCVRSWPRRQIHSAQPVNSCQSKLTALICHTFYN